MYSGSCAPKPFRSSGRSPCSRHICCDQVGSMHLSLNIVDSRRYIVDNDTFYEDVTRMDANVFPEWRTIHDELLHSFEALWSCVQDSLCADAPEGHVPDEMEEEMSLDTKEILSYSWRGLKEARYDLNLWRSIEQTLTSIASYFVLSQLERR